MSELEELTNFLRMAEMGQGPMHGLASRKPPSVWTTFKAKTAVSVGMFATSIFLFRTFGDSLA